jgi:hypothetical protein
MAYDDYPPMMQWQPMEEDEAPDMSGLASSLKKRFAKKPMGAPEGHTDMGGNMGGAHEGMSSTGGGGGPQSF